MRREIKKSYVVFNIILALVLTFLMINVFVIKNTSFLLCAAVPALSFLIFFCLYGYERKNRRFTYESMFYVFFYTILYLILTYIVGIFTGFYSSIYSFSVTNLVKNIIPYLFVIIFSELLRDEVVRKCDDSFISYSLITLIMIVVDCTMFLTTFDLSDGDGLIKFLCNILLPSAAKNVLLLYIMKIGGIIPSMIYRILMEMKLFIVPIFPDFGLYIESILATIFPVILGFITFFSLKQYKNKEVEGKTVKQSKLFTYSTVIVTMLFVVVVVTLTSCNFKYGAIAIGSGSMTGTINKGDVVIFEQLGNNEIKEKDVVVFKKEDQLIVHRIINIVQINDDEYIYYTKGDANESADGYPLTRDDIVGIVKSRVRFLGIPSVELSQLISKKK